MKRFIQISLLSFVLCPLSLWASDIECVGVATQVVNGNDTTFVFKGEIHLKSKSGAINWYKSDGSVYASGVDEIYPDEGCYKAGGSTFCVQLYQGIDDLALSLEPSCGSTVLRVSGDVASRAHTYDLYYNALAWNTEEWVDSAATMQGSLAPTIIMPPLYGATPVRLYYDTEVRSKLGLDSAYAEVQFTKEEIQAVKIQMTSLATTRGSEGEKSNEKNRPTSQTLVVGSDYSGPLEVAFYANATPGAQFYQWDIYQSTELIVRRFDPDIRYTFSVPGSYRIVCSANNAQCRADSMEMTVAVSESYLAVPNVFTPNGDGKNDEFRVAYRSLREFHCWVYNRWGHLVYEWDDPAKGWDGTINGRPAAEGAYYYVIRALGTDAAKNAGYTMKAVYNKRKLNAEESAIGVYQLSGDINLLRGKRN